MEECTAQELQWELQQKRLKVEWGCREVAGAREGDREGSPWVLGAVLLAVQECSITMAPCVLSLLQPLPPDIIPSSAPSSSLFVPSSWCILKVSLSVPLLFWALCTQGKGQHGLRLAKTQQFAVPRTSV